VFAQPLRKSVSRKSGALQPLVAKPAEGIVLSIAKPLSVADDSKAKAKAQAPTTNVAAHRTEGCLILFSCNPKIL